MWQPVSAPTAVSPSETDNPRTAQIQALKDYAAELLSGKGNARSQAADYGKKEIGGFLSTVNPINVARGTINTILHPIDTARGIAATGGRLVTGDPQAVGSALGMVAAPKIYAGALRTTNKGATTLADSASARSATGYVGGYLTAKAMGEPGFAGAVIGRAVSPLLQYPAQDVAKASGWLMNKLGIDSSVPSQAEPAPPTDSSTPPSAPTAGGMSAADKASLIKRYGAAAAGEIERKLGAQQSGPETGLPPESPMRQPRIRQGAERVGREAGLSKEQVRQQTGPILNEQQGEASPVLPKTVLQNIIDTMRGMSPAEREAYVQRASSGKTMAQVENLRRTLEHLGLLVPAAVGAGAARRAILGQMNDQ